MRKFNRREFLRVSALTAAGLVAAQCAVPATEAPKEAPEPTPTTAPAEPEEVALEIGASQPEYIDAERQIWDVFEAEHPGVEVELYAVNEDTVAAFQAKIAGGYKPAMCPPWTVLGEITRDNYATLVNLGELDDFPWWDRWTWDVRNTFTELYDVPGPRALDVFAGFVFTWQYHKDLMEKSGLDPRRDVKTWDDMKAWIAEGTAWANSDPDVDHFWDQAWHNWVWGWNYLSLIPLAFPEGQLEDQRKCWLGEAKFNAEDSPFRHSFEFFKEAYDNGWIPENFWTREWETDMEASYIAKKSVMMLHGPWPWDKMLAADPTAQQEGIPSTPPAETQETWMQYMSRLEVTGRSGYCLLEGVQELPEWEAIKTAFYWWFSPPVVKMNAEVAGRQVLYRLDEPLELTGPQWVGILTDIGTSGGLWEDVQYVDASAWGEITAEAHRKGGAPGTWDWESNGLAEPIADLMTGKMTVQDVLDWAQANWEASYEL